MKVKIICEEAYETSIWCKQIVSGIIAELRRKRQQYIKTNQLEDIEDNSVIYLIGANYNWLKHAIQFCNFKGVVPVVLCNQDNRVIRGRYHCVCADIYGSMKQVCDNFSNMGKAKVALYGVNPYSVSDQSRMECFLEVTSDEKSVFKNNGNLEECYQKFLPYIHDYHAVICVNSYAAISLVNKLKAFEPNILDKIFIVSCTKTILSSWYSQWISFVELNLAQYGKAAITISELVEDNPNIAGITIAIEGDVSEITQRKNSGNLQKQYEYRDLFYEDTEWMDLSKIEHMLNECTELDRQILELLLQGATYGQIAEECYVSEGTIKYHIKKYMETCNVKTKQDLLDFLQKLYGADNSNLNHD